MGWDPVEGPVKLNVPVYLHATVAVWLRGLAVNILIFPSIFYCTSLKVHWASVQDKVLAGCTIEIAVCYL